MPMTCRTCQRPDLAEVEQALLRHEPLRDIARRTGLTKDALARHRKKCLEPFRRTRTRTGPVGRGTLLTPEVQTKIVETIRSGSFDWVAARTAGISPATFKEWLRRGEGKDANRPYEKLYVQFAIEVRRAQAEARSQAEIKVREDQPLAWLRYGPGRDRGDPDAPGWSDQTEVVNRYDRQAQAFVLVFNGTKADHRVVDTDTVGDALQPGPRALDRGRDEEREDDRALPLDG
jgi:hypothetical protein